MDGIEPRCFAGTCLVPEPGPAGARALVLRAQLVALKETVDAGTILRLHGATLDDLELLVEIESLLREAQK